MTGFKNNGKLKLLIMWACGRREQQLHGWSRAKKEALIRGDIEELKRLAKSK